MRILNLERYPVVTPKGDRVIRVTNAIQGLHLGQFPLVQD